MDEPRSENKPVDKARLWGLFRSYYDINRTTFPLGRWAAAVDAARLTLKVRKVR